ncbi:DoxX family protein [Dokdonella sp.]|uniref:DoxX family protein n=1 Tax=Dokdonella sp. TaxID=2291710 RepID=UPI001B171059|nr:DoxX family protein [Dokdonella sp.]MBO9662843.1 DoxX family protein [Dokdonella sp.]
MSTHAQTLTAPAASATLRNSTELFGRILLSALFLMSGLGKIAAYSATASYMTSVGAPAALLPLVILTEVGGAIAIIAGWKTRIAAILLAGFTVLTALMFHSNFGDQNQMIHFMKNIAIAGGFLMLAANGAGGYSLDARSAR